MSQESSPSIRVRPPPGPMSATVSPPGSKSLTNRALILAALASGRSTMRGCLDSEDTRVMLTALERFGLAPVVSDERRIVSLSGKGGPPDALAEPTRAIEVATAGTAARFLTAVLAAAPLVSRLDGSARMRASTSQKRASPCTLRRPSAGTVSRPPKIAGNASR